jgi:hypothetical protein
MTIGHAGLLARAEADPAVAGVILSGSQARGTATRHSDADVIVVVPEHDGRWRSARGPDLDVAVVPLAALADVSDRWQRYAYRGARVLLDRLDGRIGELVRAQATLTPAEADAMVRTELDGYLNFIYRAAKNRRAGRPDLAERPRCLPSWNRWRGPAATATSSTPGTISRSSATTSPGGDPAPRQDPSRGSARAVGVISMPVTFASSPAPVGDCTQNPIRCSATGPSVKSRSSDHCAPSAEWWNAYTAPVREIRSQDRPGSATATPLASSDTSRVTTVTIVSTPAGERSRASFAHVTGPPWTKSATAS